MQWFVGHFQVLKWHLLERAWASYTLASFHMCVCMLACLLIGSTTYLKFQMRVLKYFMKIECPWWHVLQLSCVMDYCQTVASASRQGAKATQLNAFAAHTVPYFLPTNLYILWVCKSWTTESWECMVARFASGKHLVSEPDPHTRRRVW